MTHALLAAAPNVNVNINGLKDPSTAVLIIIVITVLAIAPAILILATGFTRIFIVLSLTRSALGTQTVPPNQVIAGLSLIIALFIMSPVFSQIDHVAVQPYEHGKITATQAIDAGEVPLKHWMLEQTKTSDLQLFASAAHEQANHPAVAAAHDRGARLRPLPVGGGLPDRLHDLHPVHGHRPGRLGDHDVDGDVHAPPHLDLAPLQDPAVRPRGRVDTRGPLPHPVVPSVTRHA